jgi:hypothetical protein
MGKGGSPPSQNPDTPQVTKPFGEGYNEDMIEGGLANQRENPVLDGL